MIHSSKHKLLIICGPTATGKTALALELARIFHGDIISADSRQVYKEMDIGTGKDVPESFKFQVSSFKFADKSVGCYSDGVVKLWGLDLVNPDEEFTLATYRKFALQMIPSIWAENKLPIVVGGTGLYIRSLLRNWTDVDVPNNEGLRKELSTTSVEQLQTLLNSLDSVKYSAMNHSDRFNPRRLVRAIEIAQWKKTPQPQKVSTQPLSQDVLSIGLTATISQLKERISQRVNQRVSEGIINEVRMLRAKGYDWSLYSMSAIGYRQWRQYFDEKQKANEELETTIKQQVIEQWKKAEYDYAKRQLTWFKKEPGIIWFDVGSQNYRQAVLATIEKWYTKKTARQ